MKINRLITLFALAALGIASAVPAQQRERRSDRDTRDFQQLRQPMATTAPAVQGYTDRYAILERNNIFVRDRSRPAARPSASTATQPVRRSLEQSLVVRGIAMEELGYRAYVENLNTGATLRISPGEPLGRGHVTAVALDAIQYALDDKQTWIEIGSDLTGRPSATTAPSSPLFTSASPKTSPATLPANVDMNDPSLTVEQRMRLRRLHLREQQRGQ